MPIATLEDELYHHYDRVVATTLNELINRSPYHDTIRLRGFDRKNKEHLFILRLALMARDMTETPVEICCKKWEGVIINWKIRKSFNKVAVIDPNSPSSIWVPSLIGKIKSLTDCAHLDVIYDAYYEGGCG